MYDGTIYVGGKIAGLGVDAVPAEMTDLDVQWLERKLKMYGLAATRGVKNMHKISAGGSCGITTISNPPRRNSFSEDSLATSGSAPLARGSRKGRQDMAKEKKVPAPLPTTKNKLGRNTHVLGHSSLFTPEVIDDIHIKSELGRYRMRGFSLFKKIPSWDDLTFLPGTLTRFVIEGYREKCETRTVIGPRAKRPLVLDIPVYITGMSFGALSYEAKIALARGATMAGTATCSGEGGMIPDERPLFLQVVLSMHPVALRFQPEPSAPGRRL